MSWARSKQTRAICASLKLAPLTGDHVKQLLYSVLTEEQKLAFERSSEVDFSFGIRGVSRFRANAFLQRANVAAVFRQIPLRIPPMEELGLAQVTASGVGIIIGAGIYALLGAATVEAGASVWASFAVAGVLSALTALSYCELASMYPAAGAEFDYARRAAPAWVAFLVGWVMIVGLIVGAGAGGRQG